MFAFLVSASLKGRVLVIVFFAALMIYGGYIIPQFRIDVLPELKKGLVTIVTEAPGLAPEEVEVLVTYPIESAMSGASGVTRVRSASGPAISIVYVEFDWDTDMYRSRQIVTERLAPILPDLPHGVQPLIAPLSALMGEILLVSMSSDTLDPMSLRDIADWVVVKRLLAVPGVSRVIPVGGLVRQYRVTPDMLRMSQLGVSVTSLHEALTLFGTNTGGGIVDEQSQEFLIRNLSRTQSLEDLRNVAIDHRNGQPILLRQVADVSFEPRQRRGAAGYMGEPAVVLSIQKQPDADTVLLTRAVERVLAELQESMPAGVRANDILFRQADFIESSVGTMSHVLGEAIAIVAVILFLFLFNVRTTAISLTAIPVSVLMTFIAFRWLGFSINTMTLGGLAIAIGELVDDAVVDVENIYRRLKQNRLSAQPRPAIEVIAAASQEIRSGIVYSTAIIVLVFVPLFAIPGIEGRLFAPLGIAYIVSILASLLTSIVLTPVMCSYLLPHTKRLAHGDNFIVRYLKRVNGRAVSFVLKRPGPIVGTTAVAVGLALAVVPTLPRSFMPAFNEGTLVVAMILDPGISLAESSRVAQVTESVLRQVPEVTTVGYRTGRSESDEHAKGVNVTEFEVGLQRSKRRLKAILADIRARLGGMPATFSIGQPMTHRLIENVLTGTAGQIVVKIFGDNLETLRTLAESVERQMAAIPGVTDLAVEKLVPVPQLRIQADPQRALLYGIAPGELMQILSQLVQGDEVSQIIDGNRRFDVIMRLAEQDRTSSELSSLLIDTPAGRIPLSLVASVTESNGPNEILRENGQRRILVTANGDGTNNNQVARQVARIVQELALPPGYFAAFEGVFAEQTRSALRMGGLALVSMALIFAILFTRYRSTALSLIIMGNVPLALIGSVIAIKVTGLELSIATMIGFVTLTGISTRNGILKVSHYINLVLHEGERFGPDLVIRGSQERLVPVLMTAASAGFALVPLLMYASDAGKEILHPVAVVIFGGLISSTLLDALLTPLLFYRFGLKPLERLVAAQIGGRPAEAY